MTHSPKKAAGRTDPCEKAEGENQLEFKQETEYVVTDQLSVARSHWPS